jgi:transposase
MRLPSRWFLAVDPIALCCGMDRLLAWVQRSASSASGYVGYVIRNRAGSRIKLLLLDVAGVWLSVHRLHTGRLHWPRSSDEKCELSPEQFAWPCAGVNWMRFSRSVVPYT